MAGEVKTALIVGAGGFIGGFMVLEGLKRGYETWAGVRETTSRRWLTDPRLKFLVLDYENVEALTESLRQAPRFDLIVYNLGATKCANFLDFNRINYGYLKNFIEAMNAADRLPERFVFMSSLSALGPGDEQNYTPLDDNKIPEPNTRYGLSKIKAETLLEMHPEVPWIIMRPTGVYGPHELDYLMMVKSIDAGWDFGVGYRQQQLTFIYVDDLVNAVYDAADRGPVHRKFILSEPRAYTQKEFREIVKKHLGRRFVIPVRLPLWTVKIVSLVAQKIGEARLKPSTLNTDKFKIMAQRNWNADISTAVEGFGFDPQISLDEGIKRVVEAYRESKSHRRGSRK